MDSGYETISNPTSDGEFYEIEQVLDHGLTDNGSIEYLVKWANYDESHNSWILGNSFDLVRLGASITFFGAEIERIN